MPNRKEPSKAEVEKLLELIHDHKIHFIPAIALTDWDRDGLPCKNLFEQILQISNVKFTEYPDQGHHDSEGANQKKLLVRRIQANAARCKRERDNEAGWINNVASLVFERLDSFEFHCQRCRRYLWLPDFIALPGDCVAADRLQRRYTCRRLCRCTAAERADAVRVNYDRASIFSNKSDERVMHDDSGSEGEQLDQKYKRPDRVYGLGVTSSFLPFRERFKKYSPFTGHHTLFPFLLFEAKSEKSGQGFEQIENQTALSIRTCLKLQIDLEHDSNQILDPVVWFFGSKGEEWRLYLACMVGDATKVVDCWHGYIQNADQALQLLLLIDWISGWAKDVYRPGVVRCLSGLEVRDATPAGTLFSFHGDYPYGSTSTRSNSLAFRPSQPPVGEPETSRQRPILDEVIHIEDSEDEIMAENIPDDHCSTSEDTNESDSGDIEESRVVRNACSPVYRWKHLDIPEEPSILSELLCALGDFDGPRSAARYLWRVLTDEQYTSKISLKTLSETLRDSIGQAISETAWNEPIATWIICQRRLVETSWQVMCNFWCITCSQSAARLLAAIAGVNETEQSELVRWRAHDCYCDCLASVIGNMGHLEGRASATAAIKQDIYCVISNNSQAQLGHHEWRKADRQMLQRRLVVFENLFKLIKGGQNNILPSAINCTSSSSNLRPELFETNDLEDLPGVLLKRPAYWPDSCPLWCFLQFDNTQQESIETQVATAYRKKAIFATEEWNHGEDEELLRWPGRWRE